MLALGSQTSFASNGTGTRTLLPASGSRVMVYALVRSSDDAPRFSRRREVDWSGIARRSIAGPSTRRLGTRCVGPIASCRGPVLVVLGVQAAQLATWFVMSLRCWSKRRRRWPLPPEGWGSRTGSDVPGSSLGPRRRAEERRRFPRGGCRRRLAPRPAPPPGPGRRTPPAAGTGRGVGTTVVPAAEERRVENR